MIEPRTPEEAARLIAAHSTIRKRARTLFSEDRYTFRQSPDYPTVYFIYKPGDEWSSYAVDVQTGFCTCAAYEHFGLCKHLLAVREELLRMDALCAEYEARGGAERDEWCRAVYGTAA